MNEEKTILIIDIDGGSVMDVHTNKPEKIQVVVRNLDVSVFWIPPVILTDEDELETCYKFAKELPTLEVRKMIQRKRGSK